MGEIVPICIYDNFIGLPQKSGEKNYICPQLENLLLEKKVWVINPDFRPIPPGTVLFCVQQSNFSIVKISIQYDPFDQSQDCVRFITWAQPTPYAIPLFIYKYRQQYKISLKPIDNSEYHRLSFSPIYVLPDNTTDFKIVNNTPQYRFTGTQGICVPNPTGQTLGKCITLYNKNILNPTVPQHQFSLLNYIGERYGDKKFKNPFKSVPLYFIVICIIILIVCLLTIKN